MNNKGLKDNDLNVDNMFSKIKDKLRFSFSKLFNKVNDIELDKNEKIEKEDRIDNTNNEIIEDKKEDIELNIEEENEFDINSKEIKLDSIDIFNNLYDILKGRLSNIENIEKKQRRSEIINIKKCIIDLKKQYKTYNFDCLKIDKNIDQNNFIRNDKALNKLLDDCNRELNNLKRLKRTNLKKSINDYISDERKLHDLDINIIKDNFKKSSMSDKRMVLLDEVNNYLDNTISVKVNLNYDKKIKKLTKIIIINDRIRLIRKILNKKNKNIILLDNIELINKYYSNDKTDILSEVINDTLIEIKNFKQEFEGEFYYDMDRYTSALNIMSIVNRLESEIKI